MKRYYENEDKLSSQRRIYEENRERLLQKQNDRYINFRELQRSYVELQNRLKALEEIKRNQNK